MLALDMSTDSFGTPENFSGIFPANFLTKNSEETTGPKGRRGSKGEPAVPPSMGYRCGEPSETPRCNHTRRGPLSAPIKIRYTIPLNTILIRPFFLGAGGIATSS